MDTLINEIEKQQPKEHTDVWAVGEQLKDILRRHPEAAEMVLQDLGKDKMRLPCCAAAIRKHADEINKKTKASCVCITPMEAERIISEFYGIAETGGETAAAEPETPETDNVLRLEDFF